MSVLKSLGPLLSATANERRKQVPVRILLALLVAWALYTGGRSEWIVPWLASVVEVQLFEFAAMFRFRRSERIATSLDVLLALGSTVAMAALFAGMAVVIWSMGGQGLEGMAMLVIAGGLLTNVASGMEARSIFFVGATPYLVALTVIPLMAVLGAPSGDPLLTPLGSLLFTGAIMNVYWRVHGARAAELGAIREAELRVEQAEAAMADRAAMAAIVSHELRTPVSAILAGAHVMRNDSVAARREVTADLIVDAGDLMTRMLNDLLDHSKMEAGAMTLEARDFDLAGVVADTERFWLAQATDKGLVLRVTGSTGPAWLRGDPYRLRQVLNNLLSNALKFTPKGTIEIAVDVQPAGASDRVLTLAVRHEGAGIAPDAMARLFTPFAQGSAEVARTYGGTGLGLKVSRDLARLMGGDLTVSSEPGRGATFTLSVVLPAGDPAMDSLTTDDAMPVVQPRLRVLAVDDHEINRRTLALVLQPLDVDLSTASDGTLALDLLARQAFDVVLMDVNMPGIDGNEATRRLRASRGLNADVPVIGFSAGTEAAQISACRAAGMTDWLAKPLEPRKLYDALHRAAQGPTSDLAAVA